MAVLSNGIETLELGVTDWVTIMNANMLLVYTSDALETLYDAKALATHLHSGVYEPTGSTINQTWLQTIMQSLADDIKVTTTTKGITMFDTTTSTNSRLYLDNGVLSVEVV